MAIIHKTRKAKAEFEKTMDKELDSFIEKMASKPTNPVEDYIHQNFSDQFLVGYYIKHANVVDKRLAGNPSQQNYLCIFFDWVKTPSRILKHYGFGSKLDNHLLIRNGHEIELDACKNSNRMLRKCIYNWNDAIEYHIRLGLPVSPLVGMSKDYVLDGLPVNLEQAAKASLLEPGSFSHRLYLNGNQHQLMI